MKNKILVTILFIFIQMNSFAISKLERVEPAFWWVGMKYNEIQLIVYGENIASQDVDLKYEGVTLKEVHKVENANYLFLDIAIAKDTKPGFFDIKFKKNGITKSVLKYELKERNTKPTIHQGFDASDVVYLLMPDRFANGNPDNDSVEGLLEKADRNNLNGRHGGDLKGISDHIDYFKELGVTALWLNPFLENNLPAFTYHGYAITDLYKTDERLGTNDEFLNLVDELHNKDLKIIMDMIFNHIGINHYTIKDLPMHDWMHDHGEYFQSNYRAPVVSDPYSSEYDEHKMLTGWFDKNMADMNQMNPYVSKYFIQNSIWWVEYAGLDGIRVDTQPYPYKEFMSEWSKTLMEEFPTINIVGEAWLQKIPIASYYQKDSKLSGDYNSYMPTITDFPMFNAISAAFSEEEGWKEGMARLYYVLAQDFVYADPSNLLTFCDNHDLNRYYETMGHEFNKYKMGLAFLLTTRGIPQIYYGTEILMDGEEHKGHGYIRQDFPGGWAGDSANAFTEEGRTKEQNDAFNFLRTILNWRKDKEVIHTGKLKHFIPENGMYVYFRYNDEETVMVVLNNLEKEQELSLTRFKEIIKSKTKAVDVITNSKFNLTDKISIKPKSALILELE